MLSFVISAQEISEIKGNYKNLKSIAEYNLVFDYSNLTVTNFDNEESYLNLTMLEKDHIKTGDGAVFREEWFGDRKYRYEPQYIQSFNEYFKKEEVKVAKDRPDLPFTMKVHTVEIYPGYNSGFTTKSAKLAVTISIYDTLDPNKILFSAKINKVEGAYSGKKAFVEAFDFHQADKISNSYWNLGKYFAKQIRKSIK